MWLVVTLLWIGFTSWFAGIRGGIKMKKLLLAGVAALSLLSASAAEDAFTPTPEMAGQGLQCGKTKIVINSEGKGLERSRRANWKHGYYSREAKAERSRVRAAILAVRYLRDSI
jgi:hypothetical protein